MQTIGKIIVLALTLSLAFVLSACGSGTTSSKAASSGAASSDTSASASSASTQADTSSKSASATSATSSAASSSTALANATSYSNDAFGLDYSLPAGWSFTDAASLRSTNSPIASAANSDAIDMAAISADQNTVVVVALIQPSSETAGMTAESFLKAQTEQMQSSLEGTYAYTTTDADITFTGMARTLPANFTTITENGKTLVIGQAVAEKDGYFLDVLATGSTEADVENAFKDFKATAE